MKVKAKCQNSSGCVKAYRGEILELEDGSMLCPECGKPATAVSGSGGAGIKVAAAVVLLGALGAGAYYGLILKKEPPAITAPNTAPNTAPAETPGRPPAKDPAVKTTALTTPDSPAEPPTVIVAPGKIDLSTANSENKQVKAEVLSRVDMMPNISAGNKDKLYASVDRARSMGKILTIPFASGKTALANEDVQALRAELEAPRIMKLRDDPTAVFVVLGYADPKGDKQKNLAVSQARADAVLGAMRDKCAVSNVTHSVAMGGSTLVDAQNLEKNRIVEVWAVLP